MVVDAMKRSERSAGPGLDLRAGEWVEVRSAEEILGTLDEHQALDGLPFMPEMLQYCGKRLRVYKSAHKTCDTIKHYAVRRMSNTVHLENLRCDGSSHGGCQAGCLLFWKGAWLKRVSPPSAAEKYEPLAEAGAGPSGMVASDFDHLQRATRVPADELESEERYRCQATDLLKATSEVRRRDRWNPLFYVRDLTTRNVRVREFVSYGLIALVNAFTDRWMGRRYPRLDGLAGKTTPSCELHLQAGERVEVRPKTEIMHTLNAQRRNRGLSFDVEMVPYCGRNDLRVLRRVERIIDERSGRMMKLPSPCLILDGVTCGGKLSSARMFCPRSIYPYWHEIWLKRPASDDSKSAPK